VASVVHNRRLRRMAGDDDDDDDDVDTSTGSAMGLPRSVTALLGRMTSYSDRMAWTVVEDACRVCLTLSWEVGGAAAGRRRVPGRRGDGEAQCAAAASCKESLWTRIRRSLHPRRSVSVDSTTTTATAADLHRHPPQMTSSHWRSRDANDERACAARERWRTTAWRHVSRVSASMYGT